MCVVSEIVVTLGPDTGTTFQPVVNWEAVARAETHPLRLRIVERAARLPDCRFSAKDLSDEWGDSLGTLSYHLRELHAQRLLAKAGDRTERGATQRYYRAAAKLVRWQPE
jgi:hypothetical protein